MIIPEATGHKQQWLANGLGCRIGDGDCIEDFGDLDIECEVLFQDFTQHQLFPIDGPIREVNGVAVCPDICGGVDVHRDRPVNGHLLCNGMVNGVDLYQGIGFEDSLYNWPAKVVLEEIPGKGNDEQQECHH